MNPLLTEAIALASPYVQSCIEYFADKLNKDDDTECNEPECTCSTWSNPHWPHRHGCPADSEDVQDIEAMAEELREVMRERDSLRRQLCDIRTVHEELYRALYPGLASMKWNLEK